jgi:hypothetical protein
MVQVRSRNHEQTTLIANTHVHTHTATLKGYADFNYTSSTDQRGVGALSTLLLTVAAAYNWGIEVKVTELTKDLNPDNLIQNVHF